MLYVGHSSHTRMQTMTCPERALKAFKTYRTVRGYCRLRMKRASALTVEKVLYSSLEFRASPLGGRQALKTSTPTPTPREARDARTSSPRIEKCNVRGLFISFFSPWRLSGVKMPISNDKACCVPFFFFYVRGMI